MMRVRALGQDTQLPGDPFNTPDIQDNATQFPPQYVSQNEGSDGGYTPNISTATSHNVTYYEPPPSNQPRPANQYYNPYQANLPAAATAAFIQARYGQPYQTYPFTAAQQSLVSPNISNGTLFAALGGAALLVLVIALR